MTNKEIASAFNSLGKIMELHDENPYKIRSYQNAYFQLRKVSKPIAEMTPEEIAAIKGVGNAIAGKIKELLETGTLETYQKYQVQTPIGVQEMLQLKGFGPKKIRVLWKDLGAESIVELLYACNENRLIELKGFGHKTQENLKAKLAYFLQSRDKFHYAKLEPIALKLIATLRAALPNISVELTGAMARRLEIVEHIDLLVGTEDPLDAVLKPLDLSLVDTQEQYRLYRDENNTPIRIFQCAATDFGSKFFRFTGAKAFLDAFVAASPDTDFRAIIDEKEIFTKAKLAFIPPELRENADAISLAQENRIPKLIEATDIKGVLHCHTTYSDGINSVQEMAEEAQRLGYDYIGITDHSKSAFYANGLKPDRVLAQMEEIDQVNAQFKDFKIFKGIESDILNDGNLDYDAEILAKFDFIVASVHANLKMDKEKATTRLIKAIENPYTTILGHPTGRLLLSREGYPINHEKVIEACAANGVVIELNANPYRLDIDWRWIPYALERGVKIAINPDAHSLIGIQDIHFGLLQARKGGLTAATCFNNLSIEAFQNHVAARGK
ncbi:MAG: PHP domain-containing protein [Saprospiraceae bacterium]